MLSKRLEETLHRALAYASERGHEYATLEHLLLGLTDDPDAIDIFRACSVDLGRLRREVVTYLDNEIPKLPPKTVTTQNRPLRFSVLCNAPQSTSNPRAVGR